jgi:hypothetical protein
VPSRCPHVASVAYNLPPFHGVSDMPLAVFKSGPSQLTADRDDFTTNIEPPRVTVVPVPCNALRFAAEICVPRATSAIGRVGLWTCFDQQLARSNGVTQRRA